MLVYDLDGKQTKWKINGKELSNDNRPTSSLHRTARDLLKSRFPTYQILEEVPIRVNNSSLLYLDFYLPVRKLAIEVQGEQHYSFNSMFHKNKREFLIGQKNDRNKKEWCDINGIQLLILSYKHEDSWSEQLQ